MHGGGVRSSETNQPAVILLSGGLDSATVLAMARRDGFACHCVTFDYGQRHRFEIAAAARVAESLGAASHRVAQLDPAAFAGSALTGDIAVPKGGGGGGNAIPVTYVPARNLIFLSYAVGLAEVLGARDIFIGVNQLDYSGYPDCRAEFIAAFERAANLATKVGVEGSPCRIRTPLIDMTKAQIIRAGTDLGVEYALTRSCYDPDQNGLACGGCEACMLRRAGFERAGVADPTGYAGAGCKA
ncbi:MAG: 7-cyano-7-deazaguanine synthase QueC [Planctomycetes bacterium]|nr:7-cyano-7-deazaguanine synthase QueC [Planctomycetota bacterium]